MFFRNSIILFCFSISAVVNLSFELLAGYRYEEENREETTVDELYIERDGYLHGYL